MKGDLMYVYKKANPKKYSRTHALQASVIFLFIAVVALISIWLPAFIANLPLSGS
jgi:uncharacterized membrane protein